MAEAIMRVEVGSKVSEMSSKEITTEDAYNVLIALKLSRQSNKHKEDNLLDAVAYIGSLNNYKLNTTIKR